MGSLLTGKVAIVTGGGTGIGLAIATMLAEGGAKVVIVGRRLEPLEAAANSIEGDVSYTSVDVSKDGSAKEITDFAVRTYGGIDILVNNAAMSGKNRPLAQHDDAFISQLLNLNIKSALSLMRECEPHLEKGGGSIVNISSVSGQFCFSNVCAYSCSKAAMDQLTRVLAIELGPKNIRVNAVAPGATETEMSLSRGGLGNYVDLEKVPLRRMGYPKDVAPAVVWLASEDAHWVTGQIIQSSGGLGL